MGFFLSAGLRADVGQGALGFTFACGSPKLLANFIKREAPPFSMDGLPLR